MTDVARSPKSPPPTARRSSSRAQGQARSTKAMIDRYTLVRSASAIYAGIALFLFFVLAPFIEGFLVSLKPLSQLFSSPYSFWPEQRLVRRLLHDVGSACRFWAATSSIRFFISSIVTLIVLIVVVPAAYAFARFQFPARGAAARRRSSRSTCSRARCC